MFSEKRDKIFLIGASQGIVMPLVDGWFNIPLLFANLKIFYHVLIREVG